MKNKLMVGLGSIGAVFATGFSAFAAEPTATETAITGALTTVQGDVMSVIAAVAPIAISIMGAFLVWKLGIKFFKRTTN
ncbi:MAG: hypothetical protein RBR71_13870 [Gudongella sp.]|nr:hypothetical protein [Gudongella sp.]